MRIAITGGTGFVGRHLARRLIEQEHQVALVARGNDQRDPGIRHLPRTDFFSSDLSSVPVLCTSFQGCDAVVHCAGINREIGGQTYERVHVEGTKNIVTAAEQASVRKIILLSFLRARPNCGSAYHESKWTSENIVRSSGLDYTILKAGVIYGRGDHLLDHLSRALHTVPVFALPGFWPTVMRPLAVEDLISVMEASLVDPRLSRKTFGVTGPEELTLEDAVRRIGKAIGKTLLFIPMPLMFHRGFAWMLEKLMKIPLISVAQVRILSEGLVESAPPSDQLPVDLLPKLSFHLDQIKKGLPEPGAFGFRDLRCISGRH